MTQEEVIDKLADLSTGFSFEERISLDDIAGFLSAAEQKVLGWLAEESGRAPLSAVLPEDLPLGDQIGLDYLHFIPVSDDTPR